MIKLYSLLFLLLVYSSAHAQVLKTTDLDLNPGGVIHDVAYDSYYDAYIVVGEFISIDGFLRNNLAFIDANTLTVMDQAPITGVNSPIRSVEVINSVPYTNMTIGFGHRHYIYLGGNFTTINSSTKISIARLFATHYISQPPTTPSGLANYNIQTNWDAEFSNFSIDPHAGVHDLLISGDTLIATGNFSNAVASYIGGGDEDKNAMAIDANSTSFTRLPMFSTATSTITSGTVGNAIRGVRKLNNRYFLFGSESINEIIYEYTSSGTFVQNIEGCGAEDIVYDFEVHPTSVDTLFFSYEKVGGGFSDDRLVSYLLDGTVYHCPATSVTNTILNHPGMGLMRYFDTYEDFIFTSNSTQLLTSKRNGVVNVPILNTINLNSTWMNGYPSITAEPCLKRVENLLFLSGDNLTSVDGTGRTGLAVFCLEPTPAESFTQSNPTACEEDSSTYTIPQAQCADGYRWSYTGSGAFYRITGSGNPWAALSTNDLIGINANSIDVYYPLGVTGGTLTVEPFTQFSTTDNTYSQGQSIAITINPVPDIILAPTHTLNCYSDTVHMLVQTSMPNVTFQWFVNGTYFNNDSILITESSNSYPDSNYVVTLTNSITGCSSTGSTLYTTDLDADPIIQSAITTNPLEFTCLTDSMSINSNISGAIVTWTSPSEAGIFNDPYWIDETTIPSGDLTVFATYISNGCSTQATFGGVIDNRVSADGALTGYNYLGGGTAIDTLNCLNPSITIQCDVTAPFSANSTAQWLDDNDLPTGSDLLTITEADANGASFLIVKFRTFNSDNGCWSNHDVLIICDFAQPYVDLLGNQSINCSQSEITLTHPMNGASNVIEGWLDGSSAQTAVDTILATAIGDYYYEVINTDNGCTNVDTVSVTQSLDLLLDMPTDTMVCPDQIVTIAPTVIGNTETPSYLWSTGSTNATETATGGIDSELHVTVSTPSGCSGTDTTAVSITFPVETIVQAIAACTDGSLQIMGSTGGSGNYQYSLDGSTWQTTFNFPGLAFGDYTIFTQDDLGCIYDTTQSLDGTASSIDMQFAASTYNEEGDTIVLVNITDFTGLDSIAWILPPTANVTFENDSMVILSMATGGWYDVDLIGYLGASCEYTYTSSVFFGNHAPLFDSSYVDNGIVDLNIYPNPLQISISTNNTITVDIEFGKSQNYTILVTNSLGQPVAGMSVSGLGEDVSHQLTFPVGTAIGAYRVHIIADYDAKQELIILN